MLAKKNVCDVWKSNSHSLSGTPESVDTSPVMSGERLNELRAAIEAVDAELVRLIGERRALVLEVGRVKAATRSWCAISSGGSSPLPATSRRGGAGGARRPPRRLPD